MKQRFLSVHVDFAGFTASIICAVHCGMLPVLLTLSASGRLAWFGNPVVDFGFIGLSFLFAFWALGRNFRRHHHIRKAVIVIAMGFVCILVGHLLHGNWEYVLSAFGGITIASGHILNWRMARTSTCCTTH